MTADADRNAAVLREAFGRWNDTGGDVSVWDDYATEDVMLRSLGSGRPGMEFTAARAGRAALRAYLAGLTEAFRMVHWTLEETVAQDDTVVGIGRTAWVHRGTGRTADTPVVVVARFRDGRIRALDEYYDTAAVAVAAGAAG
jgi:hypothetical protein